MIKKKHTKWGGCIIKHQTSAKAVICICRLMSTMRVLSVTEDELGHKLTIHPFRFLERVLSLVFRTEIVFIIWIFRFSSFFFLIFLVLRSTRYCQHLQPNFWQISKHSTLKWIKKMHRTEQNIILKSFKSLLLFFQRNLGFSALSKNILLQHIILFFIFFNNILYLFNIKFGKIDNSYEKKRKKRKEKLERFVSWKLSSAYYCNKASNDVKFITSLAKIDKVEFTSWVNA